MYFFSLANKKRIRKIFSLFFCNTELIKSAGNRTRTRVCLDRDDDSNAKSFFFSVSLPSPPHFHWVGQRSGAGELGDEKSSLPPSSKGTKKSLIVPNPQFCSLAHTHTHTRTLRSISHIFFFLLSPLKIEILFNIFFVLYGTYSTARLRVYTVSRENVFPK